MSISALALSAMALAYIEAKTLISEDLRMISRVFAPYRSKTNLEKEKKVNGFYILENLAKTKPDNLALCYPRQVKPLPKYDPTVSLDDVFVVDKFTFREFYAKVLQYAQVLKNEYGVNSESTVGIDCYNSPEFILSWFAIWSLGARPSFINYNLPEKSLVHCLKVGNVSLLLVDADPAVFNLVQPCTKVINATGCSIAYMDEGFMASVAAAKGYRAPDEDRHPEHTFSDCAMLIYTSGTTGLPKPAVLSWRKVIVSSTLFSGTIRLGPKDTVYTAMPLYHSSAAVVGLMACWNSGATFCVGRKFSPTVFWTQAKLVKATYIQYIGETCRYLLKAPPSVDERAHGVRVAYGNGLRPDVWERFKERFNIPVVAEFYAATEGPSALMNYQQGELGVGAIGRYGTLGTQIMVNSTNVLVRMDPVHETQPYRDPKTGLCVRTAANEPGEMLTRIDAKDIGATFQGYYGNKKASDEKLLRNVFRKGDVYYRTGDLLRRDSDNLVYFVDRLGDTFRWKSENVSTNEVEEAIATFDNHRHIHQAVVVGVEVPMHDGRAGFAVLAPHDMSRLPDPAELARHLLAQLPRYAVPVFVKFVESISNTGNNKIQKAVYRKQTFPNLEETIWWLNGDTYTPLQKEHWGLISAGKIKL